MKKKISRIWGIGLVIVLAASLLLLAAPVSAGTLSWGSEDLPDELAPGKNIVDLAVSGDGSVIYATDGELDGDYGIIYRSTNGGESWTSITVKDDFDTVAVALLAVAPDDPNYIAVCSISTPTVFISDDAGANWDTLGVVGGTTPLDTANDLAISVEKGGNHFVAVAGTAIVPTQAELWYYEIGAISAKWKEAWVDMEPTDPAQDDDAAYAVAFSPNFYSDQAMVAVSFDPGTVSPALGEINFSMYSFDSNSWNSGAFSDFPENLRQGSDNLTSMESASIAMAPDYLGSDEDMRIVFVGLAVDGLIDMESEGIFRLDGTDVEVLKDEEAIYSIAFDGSLLVAGHFEEITIYRSTDALADDPSVSGSTGTKEPGGDELVLVGIAGSDVVVGTSGEESAFAYSEDNGKSFNDLSMIDTALTVLSDVAVTPDGSIYLVTCDATTQMSVWMLDDRWERIYSNDSGGTDYIIRLAPDDSDIIYLADAGVDGTSVYFSSTGGAEKWHTRIYKEDEIVDMAVETDGDTIYVLTLSGYVSKSTNRGFTWGSKKSSKLSDSSMIASLGDDLVIAGSLTDGRVAYSTDGNVTWTKLSDEDFDDTDPVQVTATGLADGDFVIAASGDGVYSWELGEADSWDDISPGGLYTDNVTTGIGIMEGVLYAIAANTTDVSSMARTLTPTSDSPTWSTKGVTATFTVGPTALRMSVSGDVTKLWAIDTTTAAMGLFSYKDTLATASVAPRSPADGADIPFNTVSGEAEQIIFSWTSPSDKVSKFDFQIATDTDFDEIVLSEPVPKDGTWDSGDVISKIVGPGAAVNFDIRFMPDTTYYWKTRVNKDGPVRSAWSETRSFTTGSLPEILPPVVIQQPPAPVIQVPPAPAITITPPEIVLPAPPPAPPDIVVPAAPEPTPPVPQWALMVIIIIGAVLVIALIVLIMRTRRPV